MKSIGAIQPAHDQVASAVPWIFSRLVTVQLSVGEVYHNREQEIETIGMPWVATIVICSGCELVQRL